MKAALKSAVAAVVLAVGAFASAQAATLDLSGYIGNANVFSFHDFSAPYADVEGAIMAAGNVTLSSYTTNLKDKDAYGHYAMIVGGDLTYTGGNIHNGDVYVGGTPTYNAGGGTILDAGYNTYGGTAPVNMAALAAGLTNASAELKAIANTGSANQVNSQIFLTGTNSSVEIITINASMMNTATEFALSNFATDATIIVNVVGNTATIQGGYGQFDGYNVLFNFVDATTLNINTGANISILAPTASVKDGSGVIDGTVVVSNWDSGVQINAENPFVKINVPGLVTAVPEPETYAMLLTGLGLIGFIGRRRKHAAAR